MALFLFSSIILFSRLAFILGLVRRTKEGLSIIRNFFNKSAYSGLGSED